MITRAGMADRRKELDAECDAFELHFSKLSKEESELQRTFSVLMEEKAFLEKALEELNKNDGASEKDLH